MQCCIVLYFKPYGNVLLDTALNRHEGYDKTIQYKMHTSECYGVTNLIMELPVSIEDNCILKGT